MAWDQQNYMSCSLHGSQSDGRRGQGWGRCFLPGDRFPLSPSQLYILIRRVECGAMYSPQAQVTQLQNTFQEREQQSSEVKNSTQGNSGQGRRSRLGECLLQKCKDLGSIPSTL